MLWRADRYVNARLHCSFARLGFFQDRDVGVGVFPKGEEVLVGVLCFGPVTSKRIRTPKLKMREGGEWKIHNYASMIQYFPELDNCFVVLIGGEIGLATHVDRIEGPIWNGGPAPNS
jgi:hypothetical protein